MMHFDIECIKVEAKSRKMKYPCTIPKPVTTWIKMTNVSEDGMDIEGEIYEKPFDDLSIMITHIANSEATLNEFYRASRKELCERLGLKEKK